MINIVGNRYNYLTVVDQYRENRTTWAYCKCDCGNYHTTRSSSLKNGMCKSCGCYNIRLIKERATKHGLRQSREYQIWCSIKGRVFGSSYYDRDKYSALGMDEDLAQDFTLFLDEVGKMPDYEERWSIDRVDNSLGYTRGNMRWATPTVQARNKTKMKNNTTGVTGVSINITKGSKGQNYKSYVAHYTNLDGKLKCKYFSVNKYGEEAAFKMACDYRKVKIDELNSDGAGYSEKHGE